MRPKKTFSEIVAEVHAQPPRKPAVYPGGHSPDGAFSDPAGHRLTRVSALSPNETQQLVLDGALLAWEGCGCGGFAGGCQPTWVEDGERIRIASSSTPRFTEHPGVLSSWIDLWEHEETVVVYAHGSVVWEDALG